MAYRGRGRGGFSGGGGFGYAKQEPFVLFPDIDLPHQKTDAVTEEENSINQTRKFQKIWKGSPYYLEQSTSNERQNADVERYSDRSKPKTTIRRGSLFSILELKGFLQELTEGSRVQQPGRRRLRWNPNSEYHSDRVEKLDLFEKLEQRQGQNDAKEKNEGEGEDEDENEEEEEPEDDDLSDDDYYKHSDFDDDEDEYNMEDDGDDEPLL
ncbi:DNA-directed RNA polymerase III subunit rpc31-like [Pyrus ussuriensis x Pyrus communis]|uniref:DNA-directed RNA polymerase III subunit n=1 Tax=Pyrus ussuriensis x Pyrus communis TaxID=2448454 RepID=A0A5N5HS33_9ROSA|nr:DNA-directed RNA polymerase III subunit rpc31-like [Pyrus ussuriensis x Pyrus communis]